MSEEFYIKDRFKVLRLLYKGSFALIMEGYDELMENRVAIKMEEIDG